MSVAIYENTEFPFRSTARWAWLFDYLEVKWHFDPVARRFWLPTLGVWALHWVGAARVPKQAEAVALGGPILILDSLERTDRYVLAITPNQPDVVEFDSFPGVDAAAFAHAAKLAAKALRRRRGRYCFC